MSVYIYKRKKAREYALKVIYSWQILRNNIFEIQKDFLLENDISCIDKSYFTDVIEGVSKNVFILDKKFLPFLLYGFSCLNQVDLAIIRIAIFEFFFRKDIPFKVSINEAIKLSKEFSSLNSYKFVNAVLNKVLKNNKNIKL